jgi:hypothetical protein
VCALTSADKSGATFHFLAAAGVDAVLRAGGVDVDDARLRSLAAVDCAQASASQRFYALVEQPAKGMVPSSRSLMRYEMHAGDDGSFALTANQILGGIAGVSVENVVELSPVAPGKTAYTVIGSFTVPAFVPAFVVDKAIDAHDAEDPPLARIADLRRRVASRVH